MGYETVLLSKTDGVAIITLNRPEVLNAMNHQLVTELDEAITDVEDDDEIKAVILTGSGDRAFTAGGDIHEQRSDAAERTSEQMTERNTIRSRCSWHVGACRKPTIGAMNGLAYGGGSVLASSLDIRVGSERSKFRFLAAAYGRLNSTWTLSQQVGWPMAKELLFTGRVVEAEEAHRIGLLNHLVPPEQVMGKAMDIASTIAQNHPDAVQGIKHLLVEYIGMGWEEMWDREKSFLKEEVRSPHVEDAFKEFISRRGR